MVVQHNLRAMNSNRMLGLTASTQSKSTEKLSSGYKINRAADDAAGLSISEKMRKQIRGLSQASLNAQDGISAVQTAEGALNEVQDMLQRMNELAVKAANGTMSESDRSYIQNEIDQLTTEIDRVSETTKFNETYLLKGVENTDTVETAASTKVSYADSITGGRVMTWDGTAAGDLYATKDGKTTKLDANNFKDFIELGTKQVVDTAEIVGTAAIWDAAGNPMADGAAIKGVLDTDPDAKFYTGATGAGKELEVGAGNATDDDTGVALTVNAEKRSETVTVDMLNELADAMENTGFTVTVAADKSVTIGLAGYNIADDGKITKAGSDVVLGTVNNTTAAAGLTAESDTIKMTIDQEAVAAAEVADEDDYTVTYKDADSVKVKDGYQIYKADSAIDTNQWGAQVFGQIATEANIMAELKIDTDLLMDKDGNVVSEEDLANHFDENGTYKNTLWKKNDAGILTEVGADLIDKFVKWERTDATSEEVKSTGALTLSLQVGADTTGNNKISVDIESMGAENLGVKGLKVDGGDSSNADAAVETIAAAIEKVSAQRSALGAVQNRLEHTIANLDNVVENTTAAESQIRDTDMATEMVKFSNNNILAQAGQAMLAQANQANQGVLSLLG